MAAVRQETVDLARPGSAVPGVGCNCRRRSLTVKRPASNFATSSHFFDCSRGPPLDWGPWRVSLSETLLHVLHHVIAWLALIFAKE